MVVEFGYSLPKKVVLIEWNKDRIKHQPVRIFQFLSDEIQIIPEIMT